MSLFSEKVNIGTRRRHNREVWLQILLPLVLSVVLAGLGLAALTRGGTGGTAQAAQLATVLLAVPLFVMGIVFLALLVSLIYLLGLSLKWIPTKTIYAHRFMDQVASVAQRGADLVARPVMLIESWSDAVSGMFQRRRLP